DNKKDPEKQMKWLTEGEGATMRDDYDETKDGAKRSLYWYRWGMMVAFFIVGSGGIAWLMHEQLTRRVVGAILICAQGVIIVFALALARRAAGERGSHPPQGGPVVGPGLEEIVQPDQRPGLN